MHLTTCNWPNCSMPLTRAAPQKTTLQLTGSGVYNTTSMHKSHDHTVLNIRNKHILLPHMGKDHLKHWLIGREVKLGSQCTSKLGCVQSRVRESPEKQSLQWPGVAVLKHTSIAGQLHWEMCAV